MVIPELIHATYTLKLHVRGSLTGAFIRPNRWGFSSESLICYVVTLDNLLMTSARTSRRTALPLSSVCLISCQPLAIRDRWL